MVVLTEKFKPLAGYLDEDQKFGLLPGKRQKKLQSLLFAFLAEQFEQDKTYSESEVNEIINRYHSFDDPASLRRLMIGHNLLDRTKDGREYWRV